MMIPFPGTVLRREQRAGWKLCNLMLAQTEHAVEGKPGMVASAFVDGDAVHNVALAQIFERPKEMLRGDPKHGGANANAGIERDDFMALQFLAEAVYEVNFGADGPFSASWGGLGGLDDPIPPAALICRLANLKAAFGGPADRHARITRAPP